MNFLISFEHTLTPILSGPKNNLLLPDYHLFRLMDTFLILLNEKMDRIYLKDVQLYRHHSGIY